MENGVKLEGYCNIQYNQFLSDGCSNEETGYIGQNKRIKCGCKTDRTF